MSPMQRALPPCRPARRSARRRAHALLRTLPGRAIVIGLAIKLVVVLAAGSLSARVPAVRRASSTRSRALAVAVGAGYFVVAADRAREAPAALARPAQADPLLHLHRLRAGAADRRVLPAGRLAAVLQLQLVPGAEPAARAGRPGALPRAERRRSRFSAPADATWPASSRAGRPTPAPSSPACRSRSCRSTAPAARPRRSGDRDRRGPPSAPHRRPPAPWTHVDPPARRPGLDRLRRLRRAARSACDAPDSASERSAGARPRDGRRTRTCWSAASRFPIRRGPATRSSSICSSTTRSGSSCDATPASS